MIELRSRSECQFYQLGSLFHLIAGMVKSRNKAASLNSVIIGKYTKVFPMYYIFFSRLQYVAIIFERLWKVKRENNEIADSYTYFVSFLD